MKVLKRLPAFPLAILAACVITIAVVAITEDPASGAVQVVLLVIGLWGSYTLGQRSDLRPHAAKAYRRMATLYGQLYGLTELIAGQRDRASGQAADGFEYIGFAVGQSLAVVSDAMEDWADVVPEQAEELRKYAEKRQAEAESGHRLGNLPSSFEEERNL